MRSTSKSPKRSFFHFNPIENKILLYNKPRVHASKYYRESLVYHEMGHSIHTNKGLLTPQHIDKELLHDLRLLRSKYKNELTQTNKRLMGIERRLKFLRPIHFQNRGITKDDFSEASVTVRDLILGFTNGRHGYGHKRRYYSNRNTGWMEVMAHATSLTYKENKIMKKMLPKLNEDLMKLEQFLEDLITMFNLNYAIVGSVMYLEHVSYFFEDNYRYNTVLPDEYIQDSKTQVNLFPIKIALI